MTRQQPDTAPVVLIPEVAPTSLHQTGARTLSDAVRPAVDEVEEHGDIPPEYEAMVRVQWGDMAPLAASITRARVRAVLADPQASRRDVLRAIEGHVIEIPSRPRLS